MGKTYREEEILRVARMNHRFVSAGFPVISLEEARSLDLRILGFAEDDETPDQMTIEEWTAQAFISASSGTNISTARGAVFNSLPCTGCEVVSMATALGRIDKELQKEGI